MIVLNYSFELLNQRHNAPECLRRLGTMSLSLTPALVEFKVMTMSLSLAPILLELQVNLRCPIQLVQYGISGLNEVSEELFNLFG